MRPPALRNRSRLSVRIVERVEPAISIGLKYTGIAGEMLRYRMPIGSVCSSIAKSPFVTTALGEVGKQARCPLVEDGEVVAAGLVAERAGKPRLPRTGRADNCQMIVFAHPWLVVRDWKRARSRLRDVR